MNNLLGYCTNVHAGADLEEMRRNLAKFSTRVREIFAPNGSMGIGLWFSAKSAEQLVNDDSVDELRAWLEEQRLIPFTLNGFPYGDFHQKTVKHDVYIPSWEESARVEYTSALIKIFHQLLPKDVAGSISTLPLSWSLKDRSGEIAASKLMVIANQLHRLRVEEGRHIRLCIEPEPGCVWQYSDDVVKFFGRHFDNKDGSLPHDFCVRDYLTVCHDACHASVMFEPQSEVIDRYDSAEIRIGKVQVSAGIEVAFSSLDAEERDQAFLQLSSFAEDRYLHQTVCRKDSDGSTRFFDDLPKAIQAAARREISDETWRVHFHVPIYLDRLDLMGTTQSETIECCRILADNPRVTDFEVETYAWNVLPKKNQVDDLAEGIAEEMRWAEQFIISPA